MAKNEALNRMKYKATRKDKKDEKKTSTASNTGKSNAAAQSKILPVVTPSQAVTSNVSAAAQKKTVPQAKNVKTYTGSAAEQQKKAAIQNRAKELNDRASYIGLGSSALTPIRLLQRDAAIGMTTRDRVNIAEQAGVRGSTVADRARRDKEARDRREALQAYTLSKWDRKLPSNQQQVIREAKDQWAKAKKAGDTAGMQAAHKKAEAFRSQHGYSGGTAGDQKITERLTWNEASQLNGTGQTKYRDAKRKRQQAWEAGDVEAVQKYTEEMARIMAAPGYRRGTQDLSKATTGHGTTRWNGTLEEAMEDAAKLLTGLKSVGYAIPGSLQSLRETARASMNNYSRQRWSGNKEPVSVNPDAPGQTMMRKSRELAEEALEGSYGAGRFLGETALSIGQNLPGIAANFIPVVGPSISLAMLGSQAAGSRAFELNERGIDPGESMTRALLSGGVEVLTEKIPLDNLAKIIKGSSGRAFVGNLLTQMGIEATEESASYTANYVLDKLAKDPEASWSVQELMENAAAGAISGGFFATGGQMVNTALNRGTQPDTTSPVRQQNPVVEQQPQDAEALVREQAAELLANGGIPAQETQNPVQETQDLVQEVPDTAPAETARESYNRRYADFVARVEEVQSDPAKRSDEAIYQSLAAEAQAFSQEDAKLTQQERQEAGKVSQNFGTAESHIDNRTEADLGDRSVKAFQFDHPQLHQYYVEAAKALKQDAEYSLDTERREKGQGVIARWSEQLDWAGSFGLTRNEIIQVCDDIIADKGQENYAAAKRVELVLDDMLSRGYIPNEGNTEAGTKVPANEAYLQAKAQIPGAITGFDAYKRKNALALELGDVTEAELLAEYEAQEAAGARTQESAPATRQNAVQSRQTGGSGMVSAPVNLLSNNYVISSMAGKLGANGSKGILAAWNGRGNAMQYASDFVRVYNQALIGTPMGDIPAYDSLSDDQVLAAYNTAQQDRKESMAKAKETAKRAASAGGKAGLVQDEYVKNSLDKKTAKEIDAISKQLGVRVRFVDSVNEGRSDAAIQDYEVVIEKNSKRPVVSLLGHELTHRIQQLSPESYRTFRDYVMQSEQAQKDVQRMFDVYAENGENLTREEAMDEVVANFAGAMIYKQGLLEHFIQKNRANQSLLQRFLEVFRAMGRLLTGEHKKALNGAAALLERAVRDAAKAAKKAKSTTQQSGARKTGDGLRYSAKMSFEDQVDAALNRELGPNTSVYVMDTPEMLQAFGLKDYPMLMTPRHIRDITHAKSPKNRHWHGLSIETVKGLPELISDPVMVMRSASKKGDIVVVTSEFDGDDLPIIVAIHPEGSGRYNRAEITSNFITSMYGREGFKNFIETAITENRILYSNKKRTRSLFTKARLELPGILTDSWFFEGNLTQPEENVKKKFSMKEPVEDKFEPIIQKVQKGNKVQGKEAAIRVVIQDAYNGKRTIDTIVKTFAGKGYRISTQTAKDLQELYKDAKFSMKGADDYEVLLDKYGAIEQGENPRARDVQVPKQTADNKKVSRTVRTVMEAAATPDAMVPTLQDMVEKGEFSYEVAGDKAAIEAAEATIRDKGFQASLIDWTSALASGTVSKQNVADGWALYNAAAQAGDTKTAADILTRIVAHQRNAAQAVQATRLLKQMAPGAQLYGIERSVQNMQAELQNKYKDKAPKLDIPDELVENFLNAETEEARAEAETEIYRNIGKQMPSTFMDKWNAWRYLAMLGNVRTHIRNVSGNAGFAPVVFTKNLVGTALESIGSAVSGGKMQKTKGLYGPELFKAAWGDYKNAVDQIMAGGKYNETTTKRDAIEDGRQIFRFKPLEGLRKFNSAALNVEDSWFAHPHYANALAQYCAANKITAEQIQTKEGLTKAEWDKAQAYAIKEAQKATYRDANSFSDFISSVGRYQGDNTVKKAFSNMVEGVLPFRKTPANILVRAVEYSPIGLADGIWELTYGVKKGKNTAAEALDRMSAGLTGTGLFALGLYLASQGLLIASGDDDDKQADYDDLLGRQNYAIELPDGRNATIDWLAPECIPMFMGAEYFNAMAERDETGAFNISQFLSALSRVTNPMLEMSCLSSLNDLFDSVAGWREGDVSSLVTVAASMALSYLTQGVPTLLGQGERSSQEERMTTYTDKNKSLPTDWQYQLGKLSGKIPKWDYSQIPYIDAWGRTENEGSVLERVLNNFINPAYTSQYAVSNLEAELQRLYDATGENVLPSRAEKKLTINGEEIDLTADQYVQYATLKGKGAQSLLQELTSASWYKDLSDAEKAEMVVNAQTIAREKAKLALFPDYESKSSIFRKAVEMEEQGVPISTYLMLDSVAGAVEGTKTADGVTISDSTSYNKYMALRQSGALDSMSEEQQEAAYNALEIGARVRSMSDSALAELEEDIKEKENAPSVYSILGEDKSAFVKEFYDTASEYRSSYDENGNEIKGQGKQDKIIAEISKYSDLSRSEKSALYHMFYESDKNNPWK